MPNELPALLNGHDLIISAISAGGGSSPEQFKRANENLIATLEGRPDQRLIIVGGAGNTEVAPGVCVVHSPIMDSLPEEWKPDIYAHAYVLDQYKESGINCKCPLDIDHSGHTQPKVLRKIYVERQTSGK